MPNAVPGWWFAVVCVDCQQHIAIKEAPEAERVSRSSGWQGVCPHCGKEDSYPASAVERVLIVEE